MQRWNVHRHSERSEESPPMRLPHLGAAEEEEEIPRCARNDGAQVAKRVTVCINLVTFT
ncbi:MAG: hypothetical protein LBL94_09950 [Prevotellaceae bacterium]|nr:hypothetical protein [Prevotellaceae bacterium]